MPGMTVGEAASRPHATGPGASGISYFRRAGACHVDTAASEPFLGAKLDAIGDMVGQ
jgi:hypothetical protein